MTAPQIDPLLELIRDLEGMITGWHAISARPQRPTGFAICAEQLADWLPRLRAVQARHEAAALVEPAVTADDVLAVWLEWKRHLPHVATGDGVGWTQADGVRFAQSIRALFGAQSAAHAGADHQAEAPVSAELGQFASQRYYAQAVALVADELDTLAPEHLPERRAKIIAILRHAAHWFGRRTDGDGRSAWQPIETAPVGVVVLVHDEGYIGMGIWQEDGHWLDPDCGRPNAYFDPPPTHWMPLPSPPRPDEDTTMLTLTEGVRKEPMTNVAEAAERIARQAHAGQLEKYTSEPSPYVCHIERVVALVATDPELRPSEREDAIAVAWLHDLLEDTDWTAEALLREGFAHCVVSAVVELTRRRPDVYAHYIAAIRTSAKPLAIAVKVADLRDHVRPGCPDLPAAKRAQYETALATLEAIWWVRKETRDDA